MFLLLFSDGIKSQFVLVFSHQLKHAFTSGLKEMADIITSHAVVLIENIFFIDMMISENPNSAANNFSTNANNTIYSNCYVTPSQSTKKDRKCDTINTRT